MKPLQHLACFARTGVPLDPIPRSPAPRHPAPRLLLDFLGIALPALVLGLLAFLAVLTASSAMASEQIAEVEGGLICTTGTTCNVKKPGSDKFAPRGKRFVGVMSDMTELRDWAMKAHPQTEDVKPTGPLGAERPDESAEEGGDSGSGEAFPMMRSGRE